MNENLSHYCEPWHAGENPTGTGLRLADSTGFDIINTADETFPQTLACLTRIAACVNACRGLSDEQLAALPFNHHLQLLKEIGDADHATPPLRWSSTPPTSPGTYRIRYPSANSNGHPVDVTFSYDQSELVVDLKGDWRTMRVAELFAEWSQKLTPTP